MLEDGKTLMLVDMGTSLGQTMKEVKSLRQFLRGTGIIY